MTKTIPWNSGGGNITLTYNASEGNQSIVLTSDSNSSTSARSQSITFKAGNVTKSLLVKQEGVQKQQGSITAIPNGYSSTYSSYQSVNSSYPITRAYTDTSSTTYCTLNCNTGSRASTYLSLSFDLSSIPSNAVITSVSCKFKARVASTSYINTAAGQLYANGTAKGSSVSWRSTSTTTVYTITNCGTWTRSELNNLLLRLTATRGTNQTTRATTINIYGAELTVNYEY